MADSQNVVKDNLFYAYAEAGRFSYIGTSVDACASGGIRRIPYDICRILLGIRQIPKRQREEILFYLQEILQKVQYTK